jgi:hypothetical protein
MIFIYLGLDTDYVASCEPNMLYAVLNEIEEEKGIVIEDYSIECGNCYCYLKK